MNIIKWFKALFAKEEMEFKPVAPKKKPKKRKKKAVKKK
jgi:hypothetical protein